MLVACGDGGGGDTGFTSVPNTGSDSMATAVGSSTGAPTSAPTTGPDDPSGSATLGTVSESTSDATSTGETDATTGPPPAECPLYTCNLP